MESKKEAATKVGEKKKAKKEWYSGSQVKNMFQEGGSYKYIVRCP